MIKALEVGPDGPVMVIGLTWVNLDRLAAGQPIKFSATALGIRPGFIVAIAGGPTAGVIAMQLQEAGVTPLRHVGEPERDGLLCATASPYIARSVCQPMAVLGISTAVDRALRGGAEFVRRLPAGLPAVRLLAAGDTDRLGAIVTAGAEGPAVSVDLRGGRND